MRRARQARDPLAIGLIGFALLAAVSYVAFTKRLPFSQTYRIDAIFQTSNQLRKGSSVRIAGVDVGKVVSLRDGPGHTTVVGLEIARHGRPVHEDATVRIRPRLFLEGGFYVELSPGSPTAPAVPNRGTIPLGQTSVPVQFHQVLSAFDRPTRESFRSILRETSIALDAGGAQALGRLSRPLGPALRDAAVVAQAAQGSEAHDLSQLIRSTSRLTAALASRDVELAGLVTNLRRTSQALAAHDGALSASLRQLDGTLREAPRTLDAVDAALPSVRRFAHEVRPTLRRLPGDLEAANLVLDQVRALVGPTELPALMAGLEPALAELPTLVRRLRHLFALVKPVTDCLRERAIPVLKSEVDDGDLSSGRPVWLDLAHSMVGLASLGQSFDANGPAVRFLAGGGDVPFQTDPIPGVGALSGRTSEPILGARPVWLGQGAKLPFRPDEPCLRQKLPDLRARTNIAVPTGTSRRQPSPGSRMSRRDLEALVKQLRAGRVPSLEGARP